MQGRSVKPPTGEYEAYPTIVTRGSEQTLTAMAVRFGHLTRIAQWI
jgi:hypothetical protein